MSFSLALLVFIAGTTGLFFLDRDKSARNSKALWLPLVWFSIIGSRPLSSWLGISPPSQNQLDGSPTDAFVFGVLLAAGIIVLLSRSGHTKVLLRANSLILIYFTYCLVSVLWSPFPDVAFKRWIKAVAELVMVLIVATDAEPISALRRLLFRSGFVLVPASILLIKYSDLGRGYDPDGDAMNTGVTTNKNILGVLVLVIGLGALWSVLALLRARRQPARGRHLLAQGILLTFCVALLYMAHSATAVACFILGSGLILVTGLPTIRRKPAAVHAVVLTIIIAGGLAMLFGGQAGVVHALGRETNLTGRTDIWKAVIPAAPNAAFGAGFESFWITPSNVEKVSRSLSGWFGARGLNEAHNGYIEVYLNLGLVGVSLISLILLSGYRSACAAFRRDPGTGGLMLAYVAGAAIYSVAEAGFRMLHPMWFFLLLTVVSASAVSRSYGRPQRPAELRPRRGTDEDHHLGWSDPLLVR